MSIQAHLPLTRAMDQFRYRVNLRKKLILQVKIQADHPDAISSGHPGTIEGWRDARVEDITEKMLLTKGAIPAAEVAA